MTFYYIKSIQMDIYRLLIELTINHYNDYLKCINCQILKRFSKCAFVAYLVTLRKKIMTFYFIE